MRSAGVPVLLLLLLIVLAARPQVPPSSEQQDPQSYLISVNVDLVLLHATVRDRKGSLVSDLREQDFAVYENGMLQRIRVFRREDVPVTVGLVIDHSGSMGRKLSDVIAAAHTFVQSSNAEDEMFVVNFNENVSLGLPGEIPFTNDPGRLDQAISAMPTTGRTALYDAIVEALEHLQAGSRDKKVLVVFSDGGDNASQRSLSQVLEMAGRSSALIYTVGIFDAEDPDRNPRVLRRLARATGGEAYFPGRLNEVVAICERIAQGIRNQYTIGYVAAETAQPGDYRSTRVVASAAGHGKLFVRARAGYVAPDARRGPEPY